MHEREKREWRSSYKQTFNVYKTKTIWKLSILSHLNKEFVSVAGHDEFIEMIEKYGAISLQLIWLCSNGMEK